MRRKGLLRIGHRGTLFWSIGGETRGSISYVMHAERLQLLYSIQDDAGERKDVDDSIAFAFTSQHLGGERRWFRCSRCGRRCSVLYGGARFRCRKCYRLAYQSQNEAPMWRGLSQAQKLRQKFGGSGSMDEPFPTKPKGMHWRTYDAICRKAARLEGQVNAMEMVWLSRLTKGRGDS